jgi:hypothetical protein
MDTGNKHATCQGPNSRRDDIALNVTSGQMRRYEAVYGPGRWTFVHKGVRFSGFYSALAGSRLAEETEMWRWLEGLADLEPRDHHVLFSHYPLFIDRMDEPPFDMTDPAEYALWYFSIDHPHRERIMAAYKAARVDVVVSGHIHCRHADVIDDVLFVKAPSTAMSQLTDHWPDGDPTLGFLRFDVADAGLSHEFVPLERVSDAAGYGPGGHPKPEARDYSLAWEK